MAVDSTIRENVEEELRWDPDVDDKAIGVSVRGHVVTLTGFVHRLADKVKAEQLAKRISGVAGVANDIMVRVEGQPRPDPEIAQEAVKVLQAALPAAANALGVVVRDGSLALEGKLTWHYERSLAETAMRNVRGVTQVINRIELKPTVSTGELRQQIVAAFRRSATIDANRLSVESRGDLVKLSGTVRSWAERADAERAAWSAPGVREVDNRIVVDTCLGE